VARHGIDCPAVTGAGTGSFEFEAASGVYTELHCGSYIFMDVDYGRNRDRDDEPTKALRAEPLRLGHSDEPPGRGPRHRRLQLQSARLRLTPAARLRRARCHLRAIDARRWQARAGRFSRSSHVGNWGSELEPRRDQSAHTLIEGSPSFARALSMRSWMKVVLALV
jgi:hypothetical protein